MHADIGVTLVRHEVSRALDRVRGTVSYALAAVGCAYLLVVGLFLWPLLAFVLVVSALFTDTSTKSWWPDWGGDALASIRKVSRFVFVEVSYVCEKMGVHFGNSSAISFSRAQTRAAASRRGGRATTTKR